MELPHEPAPRAIMLGMLIFWAILSVFMIRNPVTVFKLIALGRSIEKLRRPWILNTYRALGVVNLLGVIQILHRFLFATHL
jgi:hypothetical protein